MVPSESVLSAPVLREMRTGEYRDRGAYAKDIVFSTMATVESTKAKSTWANTLGMATASGKLIGYVQQQDRLLENVCYS